MNTISRPDPISYRVISDEHKASASFFRDTYTTTNAASHEWADAEALFKFFAKDPLARTEKQSIPPLHPVEV